MAQRAKLASKVLSLAAVSSMALSPAIPGSVANAATGRLAPGG